MRRRLLRACGLAAFVAGAIAITHHAVAERRRQILAQETIERLVSSLGAVAPRGRASVHVLLNGTVSKVAFATSPVVVASAATAAADACGHETDDGDVGALPTSDRVAPRFVREHVHREDAPDGSASSVLCVLRSPDTGERRERLTFVRRVGDGSSSAVTIARESGAELAAMFPPHGDAPGDDLAGVPRPPGSRRVVAASVVETGHSVRMYEVDGQELDAAVEVFDRRMSEAGFEASPAVSAELPDARLYVRASEKVVASFERTSGATRIAIARVDL